jgi:hypothetical protein
MNLFSLLCQKIPNQSPRVKARITTFSYPKHIKSSSYELKSNKSRKKYFSKSFFQKRDWFAFQTAKVLNKQRLNISGSFNSEVLQPVFLFVCL